MRRATWNWVTIVTWAVGVAGVAGCARPVPREALVRPPIWFEPAPGCRAAMRQPYPPVRVSDTLSVASARRHGDAAHAYAARHLSGGYAGGPVRFLEPTRDVIYLRDTTARDSVLAHLHDMPGMQWVTAWRDASVAVERVDYDAAVALDWMWYIVSHSRPGPFINGFGIETNGAIRLSVERKSAIAPLVGLLDSLGVPCRLVRIEASPVQVALERLNRRR